MRINYRRKVFVFVVVGFLLISFPLLSQAGNSSRKSAYPSPTPPAPRISIDGFDPKQLVEGQKAIDDFLADKGMKLAKESSSYQVFLREVLNDVYPELWLSGKQEAITAYAVSQLGLKPDTETQEADWQTPANR
jgi:hypothetical protein